MDVLGTGICSTKISAFVDEVIISIRENKTLFYDRRHFLGFSLFFDRYQCFYCGKNVRVQSGGALQFMSKITKHILDCSTIENTNDIPKNEFKGFFSKILFSGTIIKEIILNYLERRRINKKCALCQIENWHTRSPCKRIRNLIKTLLPFVSSCPRLDCKQTVICDNRSVVENTNIDYVFEFFTMLESYKPFLTSIGRIDRFTPCYTKYVCDYCNITIESVLFKPNLFMNMIVKHVNECHEKGKKKKQSGAVCSKLTGQYESVIAESRDVRESFILIRNISSDKFICCCVKCVEWWQSDSIYKKNPGDIYKLLKKHLADHSAKYADLKCCVDSVYLTLQQENETFQSCKPFWVFDENGKTVDGICGMKLVNGIWKRTLICLLCQNRGKTFQLQLDATLLYLNSGTSVVKFKNEILRLHNVYHRKTESETNHDMFDTEIDEMFYKAKQFYTAVLNSKNCWIFGQESESLLFNCTFCKRSVHLKNIFNTNIAEFLLHHLRTDGHWSPFTPKHSAKQAKRRLGMSLKTKCKSLSFEQIYSTLDSTDKLILLSKNCFVKQFTQYFCKLCLSHFNCGEDVLEERYNVWSHINSGAHKNRFPHVVKELEILKLSLSKVLRDNLIARLKKIVLGPGRDLVECKYCGSAVPMRFHALKNHIESLTCEKEKLLKIEQIKEMHLSRLERFVPKAMEKDLQFIKIGLIPGYFTCLLCPSVVELTRDCVQLHLSDTEHLQNRGLIWHQKE